MPTPDNLRDQIAAALLRAFPMYPWGDVVSAVLPVVEAALLDQSDQIAEDNAKFLDNLARRYEAAITEARRESWAHGYANGYMDSGCATVPPSAPMANPYAAGEHDTPAGEPAAERHEFVKRIADLRCGRVDCNRHADDPVHQPAQNPVTPMVVGADGRGVLADDCACGHTRNWHVNPKYECDVSSCLCATFTKPVKLSSDQPLPVVHLVTCARHQPATSSGDSAEHEIDTARMRACAPLLPPPGDEVVRDLCDALDRQRADHRKDRATDWHVRACVEAELRDARALAEERRQAMRVLRDQRDEARAETARLREQNLATDHDAFAALEAERDMASRELQRYQANYERAGAEIRELRDLLTFQAHAHAHQLDERMALARKFEQQRDDARARLDEIRALCDDERPGYTAATLNAEIRAILDREADQ